MDRGRRAIPAGNKACHERQLLKHHEVHLHYLANMKSIVDNKPPKTMFFRVASNAKKQQLLEDRYFDVERENRILLEKMSSIMLSKPGEAIKKSAKNQAKYSKSLNFEFRKRELMKITKENARILQAIQNSSPVYKQHEWERSAKDHNRYLASICEYPVASLGRNMSVASSKSCRTNGYSEIWPERYKEDDSILMRSRSSA